MHNPDVVRRGREKNIAVREKKTKNRRKDEKRKREVLRPPVELPSQSPFQSRNRNAATQQRIIG